MGVDTLSGRRHEWLWGARVSLDQVVRMHEAGSLWSVRIYVCVCTTAFTKPYDAMSMKF